MAKNARVAISSNFLLCFAIISSRICKVHSLDGMPEGAEDWDWVRELIRGGPLTYPTSENWYAYYKELLIESAGVGIGIAFIAGLLMTIFIIAFYCRGKKRKTSEHLAKGRECHATKKLVTDLEDKARRQRRNLWIGLFLCLVGYTVSAGLAYRSITDSEKTLERSLDGTHEFLTILQLSLCDINGGWNCHGDSIGEYLFNIQGEVEGTLDEVVDWLRDLSNLTEPLDSAKAGLNEVDETLGDVVQMLTDTKSTLDDLNTKFSDPLYDDIGFTLTLPTLETSLIESAQSSRDAVQDGVTTMVNTRNEIYDAVASNTSTVKELEYQIDDVDGNELDSAPTNLRKIVSNTVYAMIGVFSSVTTDVNNIQVGALNTIEETADTTLKPAAAAFAGVVFLPAFLLILAVFCVVVVSSPKPLYATMVVSFVNQVMCSYTIFVVFIMLGNSITNTIFSSPMIYP